MPLTIFNGAFARGAVAEEVSDRAWIRAMLEFEAALAATLAEAGLAPGEAATEIAAACAEAEPDPAALGVGTGLDGTPVPALLAHLRERLSAAGAAHLHRGATSQDVVDTAAMLVSRRALAPLLADLDAAAAAAAELAGRHRDTPQAGRTLLQQALPISFGLKAAGWLTGLDESAASLAEVRSRLAVALGGGAGTLAALGDDGVAVAEGLARRLGLRVPSLPWHGNRVQPALLAAALGVAAGVAGKVGADVALLAQTEVGEVVAGGPAGGSSTLPQKRNPVAAVFAVACAKRAPAQVATILAAMPGEHERAAGAWQAEAETLSELLLLTGSGVAAAAELLAGLEVRPERMRTNLEAGNGLVMAEALASALAPHLGRAVAHELVADVARRAREQGLPLAAVAGDEPRVVAALGSDGLVAALEPGSYLGGAGALVDRALAAHRNRVGSRP